MRDEPPRTPKRAETAPFGQKPFPRYRCFGHSLPRSAFTSNRSAHPQPRPKCPSKAFLHTSSLPSPIVICRRPGPTASHAISKVSQRPPPPLEKRRRARRSENFEYQVGEVTMYAAPVKTIARIRAKLAECVHARTHARTHTNTHRHTHTHTHTHTHNPVYSLDATRSYCPFRYFCLKKHEKYQHAKTNI